ncbi:DUF481 domain-containing protein [Mangrovitalea sediminis]|uniref:DUF481 domain-containing protein n=1 Tax=Mangrovitalea sediminis TaxID=1982043 RepID=UPI000BE57DD0|nr:DUF481 domain-containing protein [Mangrovitalea sediminis]
MKHLSKDVARPTTIFPCRPSWLSSLPVSYLRHCLQLQPLAVLAVLMLHLSPANADIKSIADPDWYWRGIEKPEHPVSLWNGDVEGGLLMISGNAPSTSFTSRVDMKHELPRWRHSMLLQSRYTRQDGQTTAEYYFAATQLDYKISPVNYTFTRLGYESDRFSGYNYRSSAAAGYGRRLWQRGPDYFDVSTGPGYRYSRLSAPDAEGRTIQQSPIVRFALNYQYHLSPDVIFKQSMNTEVSFHSGQSVSTSTTSLQSNLINTFALKASFSVQNTSPTPSGIRTTDTQTSLTLLYSF